MGKIYQANINHKKAGVAVLTEQSMLQDKEYCHR